MSEPVIPIYPDLGAVTLESDAGLKMMSQAVAIAYDQEQASPRVVAKGRGLLAEAIIEKARAHGIYVHESKELTSLLMQVDLDKHIPVTLYRAVAELLAWLHYVDAGLIPADTLPPPLTLPTAEEP